jgi:hypothetical protein
MKRSWVWQLYLRSRSDPNPWQLSPFCFSTFLCMLVRWQQQDCPMWTYQISENMPSISSKRGPKRCSSDSFACIGTKLTYCRCFVSLYYLVWILSLIFDRFHAKRENANVDALFVCSLLTSFSSFQGGFWRYCTAVVREVPHWRAKSNQ